MSPGLPAVKAVATVIFPQYCTTGSLTMDAAILQEVEGEANEAATEVQ